MQSASPNAVQVNQTLFGPLFRKLSSDDSNIYSKYARTFASWLKDERAYYAKARPEIVKILQAARTTLQRNVGVPFSPTTPFHISSYLDHPMVSAYAGLLKSVYPFRDRFVEPELRAEIKSLLKTIQNPVPINTSGSDAKTGVSVSPYTMSSPQGSGVLKFLPPQIGPSTVIPSRPAVSSTAGAIRNTSADNPPLSTMAVAFDKVSDNKYPPHQADSSTSSKPLKDLPGASSTFNSKDALPSHPLNQTARLKTSTPDISGPPSAPKNAASRVSFPLSASPETQSPLGMGKKKKKHSLGFDALVKIDIRGWQKQGASESSNQQGPTDLADLSGTHSDASLVSRPSVNPVQEVIDVSTEQATSNQPDVIDLACGRPSAALDNQAYSTSEKNISEVQDDNKEMSSNKGAHTLPPHEETDKGSSSIPHEEHVEVKNGTAQEAISLAEPAAVAGITEELSVLETDSLKNGTSVGSEVNISMQEAVNMESDVHTVSIVDGDVREELEVSTLEDRTFSSNEHQDKEKTTVNPVAGTSPTSRDDQDSQVEDAFGTESFIYAIHKGPAVRNRTTIRLVISDERFRALSLWNRRKNHDQDLSGSFCVSISCYSGLPTKSIEAMSVQELSNLPSAWPTNGALFMSVPYKDKETIFPLSPPFLIAPGGLVDLSAFLHAGENIIRITQLSDMSSYVFILRGHRPTAAQLEQANKRRQKEQAWKDWLIQMARPFDVPALSISQS